MMKAFLLLWVLFASVFWWFHTPGLSFFDGSEYALHIHSGGIAHAPGYPLYILIGRFLNFFTKDPFLAQHLINQISLAVASAAIIATLRVEARSSGKAFEPKTAWLVLLLFYSSYFVKLYTVLPEVFLMNLMLFSLVGLALSAWYTSADKQRYLGWNRNLFFLFFFYGLGAAHHHTLALTLPAFFVLAHWKKTSILRSFLPIFFGFVLGSSPLIYLFYAVGPETNHTYYLVESYSDFWFVLLRKAYGTFQLARSTSSTTPDSAFLALILGVARNFGYAGVLLFAPIPFLIWVKLIEKNPWSRCKDFFRTHPALTFSSVSLMIFTLVFFLGATLDVSSVVNRNTLLRFATIPGFLLLYWAYFTFQWLLERGGKKIFLAITLLLLSMSLSDWNSFNSLRDDRLRWYYDQVYSRISKQPQAKDRCVIFATSDTITYSLLYYNEVFTSQPCYIFSLAQFSGHFRARREEALVEQMLGSDHIERYRRPGMTEPKMIQILFRELLKNDFQIYLIHPRDIQYLGGSGLGVRLVGSAMEITNPALEKPSNIITEWALYLDLMEARANELQGRSRSNQILLDEYAEHAWIQNLFGYLRIYTRGKPSPEGEKLRMRSLHLKSRLALLMNEEPTDFFAGSE